ncbi:hypothetical protein HN51_026114 [Arachis hypogaea]|uniref:Uncharacterized protein n=1 Tax=Arachis hypogaea TaxID=3818 RepID=A0A445CGN7_ARAHY|nr:uncharacterized protein LOC112703280 [Arachis hypogaea]XP_057724231.1 uncharacterized protein LOC130940181 [Arachis stenosperma]QHO28642.1 uncharacterized protein DS421_7g218470 [Arachis hypogaea]RYR50070.1 hypothetical protein Ahy_A07g036626 isoform A [Arachis hypogaea]
MEDVGSASTSRTTNHHQKNKNSLFSRMKRGCLYFAVSVEESFRYVKAFFVGQSKVITARNEKEASAAELEATKMQVEAADAAEATKNKLNTTT